MHLTDPVATWLGAGSLSCGSSVAGTDAYPDRLDELTPYVASSPDADRRPPGAARW